MTKRVKMTKNTKGASDGITVLLYKKDQEYDVSDSLADNFVRQQKVAVEVEKRPEKKKKGLGAAPENK